MKNGRGGICTAHSSRIPKGFQEYIEPFKAYWNNELSLGVLERKSKFMVVVVKDIQRNWKTVSLGAETIRLCQLAGFDCNDVIINKT